MTRNRDERVMEVLNSRSIYGRILNFFDIIITVAVAVSYILCILYVFFVKKEMPIAIILVPGISFIIVSLFRRVFNAKRPYEVYDIPSVLKKDTAGKSFPSRHVFSVFVIGMTVFSVNSTAGIIVFIVGILQAAIRVIGGVHFIKDVVAGAVTGLICGMVGFYLIF